MKRLLMTILLMSMTSCVEIDPDALAKKVASELAVQNVTRIAWKDTTIYTYKTEFDTTWKNVELSSPIRVRLLGSTFTFLWRPPGNDLDWYGEAVDHFEVACLHNGKHFTGWPVQSSSDTSLTVVGALPGVYVLMVRAVGDDGLYSDWVTSLDTLWGEPWIGIVL